MFFGGHADDLYLSFLNLELSLFFIFPLFLFHFDPCLEQCDGQTLARFRGSVPLVYSRGGSMYFDKDGDLADEFYEEVMPKKGKSRRKMRKINCKFLIPQGDVPYQSPRIHVDFPVILHQV